MTGIYYDGSFFPLTPDWTKLIDISGRSFGRTSYWINRAIKRAHKDARQRFIYLRRSDAEMDEVLASGFGKNMLLTDYYGTYYRERGMSIKTAQKKIFLTYNGKEEHVGYTRTLNNVKGIDLDDVDMIIFDEFIAVMRNQYKGGAAGTREPQLFDRFIHTVFRRRKNCHVIMLGNQDALDTPTNPYNEYYKIPFKAKKYTNKALGLMYRHWDGAGDTGGTASKLSSANAETYNRSVLGDNQDIITDNFITSRTPTSLYMCAMLYQSTVLTLWIDVDTGVLYVHDNYKLDKNKPFYTAFNDDMTVDSCLLIASQFPQLKSIKVKYYSNQIRYNNQYTASKMLDVISIIKQ